MADPALNWHRVLGPDELPEGRVKTVAAGPHSFALTHYDGWYAALSNRCPHQGAGDWDVWQTTLHTPDFSCYAELCGALGEVMADPELI